jgi:hypothetical protein
VFNTHHAAPHCFQIETFDPVYRTTDSETLTDCNSARNA